MKIGSKLLRNSKNISGTSEKKSPPALTFDWLRVTSEDESGDKGNRTPDLVTASHTL